MTIVIHIETHRAFASADSIWKWDDMFLPLRFGGAKPNNGGCINCDDIEATVFVEVAVLDEFNLTIVSADVMAFPF